MALLNETHHHKDYRQHNDGRYCYCRKIHNSTNLQRKREGRKTFPLRTQKN